MPPAFSSNKQAASFAVMIAVILLLPLVVGRSILPPRAEIYSSIPWRFGGHPYFSKTIFEQKGDIDIAFIGSSRIWCDVNPVPVRDNLSKILGREAEVTTLGWNTAGFDALYFIAEDLLNNRKVKVLVVNDEYNSEIGGAAPHRLASRWFRAADNQVALAGLTPQQKFGYHASAILGIPRNLLGLLRDNLPERIAPVTPFSPETLYQTPPPDLNLGALRAARNLGNASGAFESYQPTTDVHPDEAINYSPGTARTFEADPGGLPPLQLHFARKLAELAEHHGAVLVFLHLPSIDDTASQTIRESAIWPKTLQGDVRMLGFTPETFFRGMTSSEVAKLFSDPKHLNRNGQDYFTRLITPKLIEACHAQEAR